MRTIFKSLAKSDETCFVWNPSNYMQERASVDCSLTKYATYGDGMTAHTPDYAISSDEFVDYCYSFADWMLANPAEAVDLSSLYKLTQQCRPEVLEFAASVKYKAAKEPGGYVKPMYYSLDQRKISGSENKRHDKRYEEITKYHDGGHESMYRILVKDFHSPLHSFLIQLEIRDYLQTIDGNLYLPTPRLGEPPTDGDLGRRGSNQKDAYSALKSTLTALFAMETVRSQVKHYGLDLVAAAQRAEAKRLEAVEFATRMEAAQAQVDAEALEAFDKRELEVLSGDDALVALDAATKPSWTEVEAGLEAVAA